MEGLEINVILYYEEWYISIILISSIIYISLIVITDESRKRSSGLGHDGGSLLEGASNRVLRPRGRRN